MSERTKYFVVAPDMATYGQIIRDKRLDPGCCFYCATVAEAERDVAINRRQGIAAVVVANVEPLAPRKGRAA